MYYIYFICLLVLLRFQMANYKMAHFQKARMFLEDTTAIYMNVAHVIMCTYKT